LAFLLWKWWQSSHCLHGSCGSLAACHPAQTEEKVPRETLRLWYNPCHNKTHNNNNGTRSSITDFKFVPWSVDWVGARGAICVFVKELQMNGGKKTKKNIDRIVRWTLYFSRCTENESKERTNKQEKQGNWITQDLHDSLRIPAIRSDRPESW
jgi:hypothetical protein